MTGSPMTELVCILDCKPRWAGRAQYVLDTFGSALDIRVRIAKSDEPRRPLLVYSAETSLWKRDPGVLAIRHDSAAWTSPDVSQLVESSKASSQEGGDLGLDFDLLAMVFYFLSAQSERDNATSRQLYRGSVYERLGAPTDIVDLSLELLRRRLVAAGFAGSDGKRSGLWDGRAYAVALSHDVDYLPVRRWDNLKVAVKSTARHLLKQRSPAEAVEALGGYLKAASRGDDPYGCVPAIIAEEQRRGVKSSFQVAVGHRHPFDVNYRIEDDRIRDYLTVIEEQGFDLCLHGSYRSTEQPEWYEEEVELLAQRLGRPLGSRQHFLSFDADALFAAQERAGIQYDMSMGFPDHCGSRVGFSHPYFPYCLAEERPYDVLQIPLVLMDVTLRSYMGMRGEAAWAEIERQLEVVRRAGGAVSVVWHPIVFGGARDPGFDRLYWRLIDYVKSTDGLATDGRTINALVRERAARFASPSSSLGLRAV